MKGNKIDGMLVMMTVVAVFITAIALFFVTEGYSNITGRFTGESSGSGDALLIYLI